MVPNKAITVIVVAGIVVYVTYCFFAKPDEDEEADDESETFVASGVVT